jgi:CHAT domain-containing protein/Tfp pilus assembly protein PilF
MSSRLPIALFLLAAMAAGPARTLAQQPQAGPQPGLPADLAAALEDGDRARKRGDFGGALGPYTRAAALSEQAGDRQALARSLLGVGWALWGAGKYEEALVARERARGLYLALGDRAGEAQALLAIGETLFSRGRYEQALESYRQALDANALAPARGLEATLHSSLGVTYRFLGRYDEAEEANRRALAVFREIGDDPGAAQTLNFLGIVHRARGAYGEAIASYTESIALWRRIGDRRGEAQALGNLGNVYLDLGEYERAVAEYAKSLAIAREIGYTAQIGFSELNIGAALSRVPRPAEALAHYEAALEIWRKIARRPQIARTLHNLGALRLLHGGDLARARAALDEALALARALPEPDLEALALHELGNAAVLAAEPEEAERLFGEALQVARAIGSPNTEYQVLAARGELRLRRGRLADAVADLQSSARIVNDLRAGVRSDELKIAYVDSRQQVFRALATALLESGRPEEALEAAEAGRARALADLLGGRQARVRPPEQPMLAELRAALTAPPGGPAPDVEGRRGARALDEALERIRRQNRELASLVTVESPDIGEIRATAARLQATIVEYLVAGGELVAWVVTPRGSVHAVRTPIRPGELDRLARELRRRLDGAGAADRRRPGSPAPLLRELHRLAIEPIARWLPSSPADLVVVVPHGPLALVPFAAFEDRSGRALIDRVRLALAPAVSIFRYTSAKRESGARSGALVVADPVPPAGAALERLPSGREEGRLVRARLGAPGTLLLTGPRASESAVKRAAAGRRIVHFATHGLVSAQRPADSSLVLSAGGGEDGYLRASEVFELELRADLVVLSGCATGLGRLSGDGIFGLARGFIYAGTPSVVASLWDVSDRATAFLMDRFYAGLARGLDKAAALRAAQRATRARYRHPSLWAAFMLIGEAR